MSDAPVAGTQPPSPITSRAAGQEVPGLVCLGDLAYLSLSVIPLEGLYRLARWHGRLRWLSSRRAARAVFENLRSIPTLVSGSDNDIKRLTREFFENKQLRVLLIYLFSRLDQSVIDRLWPLHGLEHLDDALAHKTGAVILLSHMNSIMGFVARDILLRRGYDVRVAFPIDRKPYQPTHVRTYIDKRRQGPPDPPNRDFVAQFNIRPIVRALAAGAAVMLTGDGWHSAGLTRVKFLGRDVYFTTGAAGISRTVGCPIVPLFVTGNAPDAMRIVFEKPMWPESSGNSERDLQMSVTRYVERLEYHLLQSPLAWEHWFAPRALDTMATMLDRTLDERYRLS